MMKFLSLALVFIMRSVYLNHWYHGTIIFAMHDKCLLEKPHLTTIHAHCCLFSSVGEDLLLPHPQCNIFLHHYLTGVMFSVVMSMIMAMKAHNQCNDAGHMDDGWVDDGGQHDMIGTSFKSSG